MQFVKSIAIAGVLATAAMAGPAIAAPTAVEERVAASAPSATSTEAADYGTREAQDPELAQFAAGDNIVIGSSVAAAILIVAALVLLL